MKKLVRIVITFLLIANNQYFKAQIPVGTWRDHLPYINATRVVKANQTIYCTTPYSLFYFNQTDNSIEKLSRANGLSDIGTSDMAYHPDKDILLIAYENANIDFIQGKSISNLNDIKNKAIQGNKKINQIVFQGNLAYLACGFGIVIIDLDRKEIKETYYIGPNASAIEVYGIAFNNNSIYAATESGIYLADRNSTNLADFNQWQKISTLPVPDGKYSAVINFESEILVNYINEGANTSIIYKQDGIDWSEFYNQGTLINRINSSNKTLMVIEDMQVKFFNANLTELKTIDNFGFANPKPNDALIDEQGIIYLADKEFGLVINKNSDYESIKPNGPYTNHVGDIDAVNNQVWVAGGERNSFWGNIYNYAEAYLFVNENWRSYILWSSSARDFVKILINPANPNQVYAGAWGAGVFVFENNELIATYNESNSSLQSIYPGQEYIRIGGLLLDEAQNLYVTNSGVSAPISVKTSEGNWYSYNYPGISGYGTVGEIINTQYNTKWV
ncbi:MAG: hypothetical protein P1P88_22580, partial [Bacteroidales bacterium]|nr:hypothetical protein [Bacteroidales bacterium]